MITALIIFLIIYLFIGLRRIPRLQVNRPAGALMKIIVIVMSFLLLSVQVNSAHGGETSVAGRPKQPLSVTVTPSDHPTSSRTFNIVLLCDTKETRQKGLQGFRRLGGNEAALFLLDPPGAATFWMGSVAYPIDIIFINSDKKVIRVYPNCKPRRRELYPSFERAAWVMETAAGSGIGVGDRVKIQ